MQHLVAIAGDLRCDHPGFKMRSPCVRAECHFDRKLAAFFDRNLAGPKVGEVADGR
jgi:hypothetical protein